MIGSDEDRDMSSRQCRGPRMVAQVEYLVVGRSRGQVTPCVVCTVHVKTRTADFLVEPENQGQRFISGLP
jgi:hypothetical protein